MQWMKTDEQLPPIGKYVVGIQGSWAEGVAGYEPYWFPPEVFVRVEDCDYHWEERESCWKRGGICIFGDPLPDYWVQVLEYPVDAQPRKALEDVLRRSWAFVHRS